MSRGVPRGMDGKQRVPSGYLALFASLYALQGVVVAYFFNYNQLYMMAGGVSKADAADAQSLALLPFILKFLGGPLVRPVQLAGIRAPQALHHDRPGGAVAGSSRSFLDAPRQQPGRIHGPGTARPSPAWRYTTHAATAW